VQSLHVAASIVWCWVPRFDNTSTAEPVLIARKAAENVELLAPGRIPEIDAVLTTRQ
jgi:hypothetical protein